MPGGVGSAPGSPRERSRAKLFQGFRRKGRELRVRENEGVDRGGGRAAVGRVASSRTGPAAAGVANEVV